MRSEGSHAQAGHRRWVGLARAGDRIHQGVRSRRERDDGNDGGHLVFIAMKDRRLEEAIRHFHPPTGFRPWHGGATVLGALRGLSAEEAEWRPHPERHSIWALALHVAYWNYAVERRLAGGPKGGFPRTPSNWPHRSEGDLEEAWIRDRGLVQQQHESLLATLTSFDPARLDDASSAKSRVTFADLVTGVVLHDTYHAGQIQMLKRMARSEGVGGGGSS